MDVSVSTFLHTWRSVPSTSMTEISQAPSRKTGMSLVISLACSASSMPWAALLTRYMVSIALSALALAPSVCRFICSPSFAAPALPESATVALYT